MVIEAIVEALQTGRAVKVAHIGRTRRIDPDSQVQTLRLVSAPDPVHAAPPTGG